MNQATKQRLVGTLVLGCLALIIIPILLDGEGVSPGGLDTTIPARPEINMDDVEPPVRPVVDADDPAQSVPDPTPEIALPGSNDGMNNEANGEAIGQANGEANVGANDRDADADSEQPDDPVGNAETATLQPGLDDQGLPEAWSVRLGIFGRQANAEALLERLVDAGYKGYRRDVVNAGGRFTGIFVGPVITRAEANALKAELEQAFDLSGLVVSFSVEEP